MPVNIANLAINMGQSLTFNWNNFWNSAFASAFGAFIGAGSAFILNKNHEKHKEIALKKSNFVFLINSIFNLRDNIIGFKHQTFKPILDEFNNFQTTRKIKYLTGQIFTKFSLDNDFSKYSFLIDKNQKIYHLMVKINKYIDFLNNDIYIFNKITCDIHSNPYEFEQNFFDITSAIIEKINNDSDNLLCLVDILFTTLKACPCRYLQDIIKKSNFSSYDEDKDKIVLQQASKNTNNSKGWDDTPIWWTK